MRKSLKSIATVFILATSLVFIDLDYNKSVQAVSNSLNESGSFIYHDGTNPIYPGADKSITFTVTSQSNSSGNYIIYLQRMINGTWTIVSHVGVPKNGSKTFTFNSEYNNGNEQPQLKPNEKYRFFLDNSDTITVHYKLVAQ